MSSMGWTEPPLNPAERLALARELHISPVTAQVLLNRGIDTAAKARAFLYPDPVNLISPEELPGLTAAGERVIQAIQKGEKILIHGDYDVDGLAATAIMLETLARLGVEAEAYIPERLNEGYGLKEKGLKKALELNCSLILTVDCGITSVKEAGIAREQGLDLIITDHHRPGTSLPEAVAVVNPWLAPGLPPLCGAGVAFKLAQFLARRFHLPAPDGVAAGWVLDLVALATIADAVPLVGENRLLVQLGLKAMARYPRPGLQALGEVAGLSAGEWTAREVAFGIVPRLNACGRLGSAFPALEILLTPSLQRAWELARHLQQENQTRRYMEESIAAEAETMAVAALAEGAKGLVLAAEGWHPGVIGIIASRLVEKYRCPVVLIAVMGDRGRGSGRSLPGINLNEIFAGCSSHLLGFGGHALAGGLEIERRQIPAFREAFDRIVASLMAEAPPMPEIMPDAAVLFSQLDWELLRELESLAPFGEGNPPPLLVYNNARIKTARQVGNGGAHLKLTLSGEGRQMEAIGFNLQLPPEVSPGDRVDLAFYLERDNYLGKEGLRLSLAALRPSQPVPLATWSYKEQVAATATATCSTWPRQLTDALAAAPVARIILATSSAVRQCYNGLKRWEGTENNFLPIPPWIGGKSLNRLLNERRSLITCHPFWSFEAVRGREASVVSFLVQGIEEKRSLIKLQPRCAPEQLMLFREPLPLLMGLLAEGQKVLLYERDGVQMVEAAKRLRGEVKDVSVAVDAFSDPRHLLLAREEALSGRMPLLIARREVPAWFYPADAVVFNYFPDSLEEVELALPLVEKTPRVYIRTLEEDWRPTDWRRELIFFYRQLKIGTGNGSRLYIMNNKGYHLRWYLAIFEELGLIQVENQGTDLAIKLIPVTGRTNLMDSRRYRQLLAETEISRQFYRQIAGGR
ncbi:hypothetical protein MHOCP_16420 [Moorella humiferrea]